MGLGLLLLGCGPTHSSSSAQEAPARDAAPGLSPVAAQQVLALIREKETRSPALRKIDSQLVYAMKAARGERIAAEVPSLETDVKVGRNGTLTVELRVSDVSIAGAAVERAGGIVVSSHPRWHVLVARLPVDTLERVAMDDSVRFIRELPTAALKAGGAGTGRPGANPQGLNVSEGVAAHQVDLARSSYGALGRGVKVGVLSDTVDALSTLQASGDLGPVTVLPGRSHAPGTSEGTAMLEIVHDVAPEADLLFATADEGEANFADNILALREAGCDIIVDDVTYFTEPPFQDGIVAQAVNAAVADGALYFSAVGNYGSRSKGTSSVYEGSFVDGGSFAGLPACFITPTGCGGQINRFSDGAGSATSDNVSIGNGQSPVTLWWSDPVGTSTNDYDLFVFNSSMTAVLAGSTNIQNGSADPFEWTPRVAAGSRLVVVKSASAADRFLHLNLHGGKLGIATDGQAYDHATTSGALSVAAVDVASADGGGFLGGVKNPVEDFSSDGPRRYFYQPDGSLANSANSSLLADGGLLRKQPDLAAADGVSVATPDFSPFFGTSAAAPHAVGIAALLLGAIPGVSRSRIIGALRSSALDIEAPGEDSNSGMGIIMAKGALDALSPPLGPLPNLALGIQTASVSNGNRNATLDPGERASLSIEIKNLGLGQATNITARLTSPNPNAVVTQGESRYPDILPGGQTTGATPFALTLGLGTPCAEIPLSLELTFTGGERLFELTLALGEVKPNPFEFRYAGPPLAIPDANRVGLTIPLSVDGVPGTIDKATFSFDGAECSASKGATGVGLDHSDVGDLKIALQSPSGTKAVLIADMLAGGSNFCQTHLDDAAPTSIGSLNATTSPYVGSYTPSVRLARFRGEPPNGLWQLNVADLYAQDTGSVRAFTLRLSGRECEPLSDLAGACANGGDCASSFCVAGRCSASACKQDQDCDDANPCTVDACEPTVGCQHAALGLGATCGACTRGVCADSRDSGRPEQDGAAEAMPAEGGDAPCEAGLCDAATPDANIADPDAGMSQTANSDAPNEAATAGQPSISDVAKASSADPQSGCGCRVIAGPVSEPRALSLLVCAALLAHRRRKPKRSVRAKSERG